MCLFSFFWAVDINTIQKWGNLRLVLFYAYSPHFPILFSIFFFWSSLSFLFHSPLSRCICCTSSLLFFTLALHCASLTGLLAGPASASSLAQPVLWPFTPEWHEVRSASDLSSQPARNMGEASFSGHWSHLLPFSCFFLYKNQSFSFFLAFCETKRVLVHGHMPLWLVLSAVLLCVGVPPSLLRVFLPPH